MKGGGESFSEIKYQLSFTNIYILSKYNGLIKNLSPDN